LPATGKLVTFAEMMFSCITDQQIAEWWLVADRFGHPTANWCSACALA
jgi:predicted ester cyclase